MSNQSAKKKRIGSRRRVANQSKTSEADEIHTTDSASVAQCHIPEEHTESLNVLANPDSAPSETQNPPSPELTGNRRKLGSSRRDKGRQHVKDSATESYHKSIEEVEGKTRGYETPITTQISLAIQPERQEELSQGSEHDIMSVTHDSSLYSATTPDYSSEIQSYTTMNCPEADLESLIPKSENLHGDQDENETDCKVLSDYCKLEETMLRGLDKYDTLQSEEVKPNAHLVAISKLTSLSVLSCPTVDQQLIDQSNVREMPEEVPNVHSVTEQASKERDEDTEFLRPDGNLHNSYVVSESHVESVLQFSTTAEISTDKSSPREDTEIECCVEQGEFSSSKEEQNEIFNLSEVKGSHHSEDVVIKVCEQEVKQTEMHKIDYSFESVTHDATENLEIISGNLLSQAEVSVTYQSELIVESTDDSATNQEDSNPGDKQDEHPTEENNFEALDYRLEDDHVYDTNEPWISDIERVDNTLDQMYETEVQVACDIKPSVEQTVHQEKEGILSEDDKSGSSSQTLQSDTNAPLDSEPQQTDTSFNPIGNRRKMGSSRRHKGRQKVKESATETYHEHKEEVVESTRGNDTLETTQMLLAMERMSQEELSQGSEYAIIMPETHDSSLYSDIMSGYSSEVQDPTTTNYSEADLESWTPKSENIQEEHDEREIDFKVEGSDKSVEVTLEGMDKSVPLQIQEDRGAYRSDDAVNKVHEHEVKSTQMQEIDYFSESVTHDATENSEIISGNLLDQAEVSDTYQSEMIVKSTDDSATNQEDSNPGDKQDERSTEENNFEALDYRHEDDHVYDTKKPWISDIERVDTELDQVYEIEGRVEDDMKSSPEQTVHQEKEGILSEDDKSRSTLHTPQSETNAPLDFEPQQSDTGFNPIGNRRKMGSSRRHKGRQKVKESATETYHEHKEEVVESTRGNDTLETTQMLLAMERMSQGELSQGSEHAIIMPETHDSSLYSDIMSGYSSEVQDPATTNYPEAALESVIPKSENIQEDHDERETDFKVEGSDKSVGVTLEGMDKSDTLQSQEIRSAHHSDDAVNKVHEEEVQPTQMQIIDYSSESVTHAATEDPEIISGNLMDQDEVSDTYQSEMIVKSTDDSATNQEDSNPGDKQDERSTEENNFEALDYRHEDDHVYDTKKPWISDIERVDTELDQLYEIEGRVEDDMKSSPEQTVHQEKEGILSEDDKSRSTLHTPQSETNAPLDFEPQQSDTGFNPIGNRRKMGSSRRHKGRQKVKESATETYHEHKEEVVESTRGNDTLETTQMLLAMERMSQGELSQGSEHAIIMPETHDSSLYSDIMSGYSSEVQDPATTNYPEAALESVIPKSENIQEDHDERETDFKVEGSDKSVGVTLEGMDKSDTLQSQEIRSAHHSDDAVNKVHEEEVQPTQMQIIDYSSESVTHAATEDPEIISGNLMDQDEVSDTYQSEMIVKSTDDSATNQEDSNPGDKQDERSTEENNFEALDYRHEDDHVYDTKKPWISDIERVDTELDQLYEIEGRVEDDMKSSPEQTVHQEKEGILSEDDKSRSTLHTPQSETNAPLDFEPQQSDTGFNPIGNRRKMGSSRRHKGRQKVKESATETYHEHKEEVVESTRGNDTLETTQMLLAMERMSQGELSQGSEHAIIMPETHDSSLYSDIMSGYSSEVQDPATTNYPEAALESVIPKSENIQEDHDERETDFKVEGSDKSVGVTLEGMDKSDTLQSQEIRSAHHSDDAVNKVHEEEVQPTQMQIIDYSSESVTHAATEDPEIISGNLMDQDEVSDTYQSEMIVKSTDDSATNQEDSNPGDKQDERSTEENNFEALDYRHEDDHVYDTKKPWISDIERVDTELDQLYEIEGRVEDDMKSSPEQTVHQEKEGILSEDDKSRSTLHTPQSETNAPLDFEPQQSDTGFNPIGNRRKMGSSRRHKGRQKVKESATETYHEHKEEVVESTRGNDTLETTQMLLAMERMSQGELSQGSEHAIIMPETHDSSLYSDIMSGYSSEVQDPATTNYPEAALESVIPKSENIQENHDERETDFKVEGSDKSVGVTLEGMDKSDTLQSQEIRSAHHSDDAVNKVHEEEVQPTQMQIIDYSSESVTHAATEDPEIISGNLMDQDEVSDTYQSEMIVKSTDDSATNQEDSNPGDKQDERSTEENNFEALDYRHEDDHVYDTKKPWISDIERVDTELDQLYEIEGRVEDDMKSSPEQTVHQEKEGILSEDDKSRSTLHTPQSETNAPLDFEPQQSDTGFNPIGNRRKMGSSRRHKGRQKVKESATETYHEHKEEVVESTRGNDTLETTQMLLAMERMSQGELSQGSEHAIIMPETHDSSLYSDIMSGYSSEVQDPATTNYPEAALESVIPKSENIQEDHDERETDFKVEGSDKSVGVTLEGMDKSDTLQSQEIRSAHHSDDAVNKVHEEEVQPTQMQIIDYSSESVTHAATEDPEIISGNLMDQDEVSDTYQSEMIVKSTDDSATNQEDSNPGDKQDERSTEENNFEALDYRHEDDHVYDTKKPWISDIERVDTELDQLYEIEGRVEDDMKSSPEQTVHQEKEGILSEDDKSRSTLHTPQSETNAPLDFEPQQSDTGFNPIGNRRKMGSSRRHKGRQKVKESATETYHEHKEEVVESTRGNDTLETTQMLLAMERMSQGELSQGSEHAIIMPETHDSSLYSDIMSGYSSEVQDPATTNYPEAALESVIPKSENIQEDHDERETDFKVEGSDKSVGVTLEGMDKSDTLQSQEIRSAHHSDDAVNKVHEEEVQPTQMQIIDYSSESVTHAATEDPEIISGNLMDQDEVSDTYQSEMIVKSTDDSATNQEDSNPGDKQDERSTEENNFEALDYRHEDDHVYDTKKPWISDIERVDTELDQLYEIEGRVEDDMKSSPEQTVHQEKEGILSEDDKSRSTLHTPQSETNAPLDFEPQQSDTGFNPIGNRRKMGSSRRHKGRQKVKESATETYHEHKEEVVESTRGNDTLETTQMLLAMERMSQGELSQGSEHAIIMPETHDSSLYSDIMSGYSSEVQDPATTNYPEAALESVIPKSENIQEDHDERETDFKVEGSDKSVGVTLEGMDKSDTLQSQEIRSAHHSDDAVNKVHEEEVQPTQMQIIDYSSESVTHAATEDPEIISGNLMDQDEVSDTYQSEMIVKSTDDSATNQEDSNPGDKQDERSTEENNFEALDYRHEDDHVYDTKKPWISDIERVDTELDQLYEIEGRVEDDMKSSPEQTVHQEKEGILSEDDKSRSTLHTPQSETNAPLDFEPQQSDTGFNPIGNRRKMGSSRRHKGRQKVKESATETYHEHKEEVVESTRGNDTLETTQMLLAMERTSQEELSQGSEHAIIMPETHDSSLYSDIMSGYSSEVQDPATTNYLEAALESLIPKSENIQEDHDERETDFKVEGSDESVGATLEGMDKSDTLQSQEVRGAHHSDDAVNKVHEEVVKPTQIQEIDYSSESVTHAATEDPEIISGILMGQAEVSDTYQSEMIVKSTDDSATNQEDSNLGDKQDEHPTEENNFEALDYRHDDHLYDTKKPWISDIERVDTALDQLYEIEGRVEDDIKPRAKQTVHQEKEGNFSEMDECKSSLQTLQSEIHSSLDSQPQQIHTGFNAIGNRRKLGSSRRNKGRQHAKDSCDRYTEEVLGNTRDNEHLETTKMSFTVETAEQEKSLEITLEGIDTFDIHQTEEISDQVKENAHVGTLVGISELNFSTLHPSPAVDQEMRDQSNFREMSEEELPNVHSVTEKENKNRDEDTDLLRHNVYLQDNNFMSESHLKLEDIESSIIPEISTEKNSPQERTEIECSVEQAAFSSSKEGSSTNEEQKEHVNLSQVRGARQSEDAVNEVHEEEVKLTHMQKMHQIDFPSIMEGESSLQTLQLEINAPLDSQPLDNSQSIKQQTHTGFNPTGSRRKMGSSRRNKGRQHVKDSFTETYHEPKEEFVENMSDEALETTKMSLATETLRQEELKEQTALYLKPAERIRKIRSTVNDEENTENVSNQDGDEEEKKLIKQPENLGQVPGDGTVKMDLIKSPEVSVLKDDSDIQNISYHDDNVNARPGQAQVSGQDKVGEEFEDPAKKDHEAHEKNVSHVITHAELFSAADNKTDTLAHIGLEENFKAESAVDVPLESEISSPQGIQEKSHLDDSENLQGKSKQKRRKMGSTRRTQLSRKPEGGMDNKDDTKESDFNVEADMRNLDKMEVVEELPMIVTAEVSQNEDAKPSLSLVHKEQQETNETSPVHDKGQKLQSSTEEAVNPIKIVQVADVRDGERNVDVSLETLHLDDFTGTEMHITVSVLAGRSSGSVNPLPSSNTEDASNTGITCETTQSTQNDEERLESVNVIQDQALKSAEAPVVAVADLEIVKSVVRGGDGEEHKNAQASIHEPNNMNEGAHDKNLEMKSASPNLNSTSKRRKMGSTRRNLGSRTKGEDLHQKQEVDNEAAETTTNVGDVKTESFSGIKEKELQLEDKDSDSEQRKEKVFETVEYSHTGESHFKPPAHETCEENPVPHGQQVETEHQLTPSYLPVIPSTSPKHDVMSESASGGRRRKMGSHRKSRGHQTNESQTARGNRITDTHDVRSILDESATKTTEESSLGLDEILEVDESDKKASSNISTSKAGEHSRPASEKTPAPVTPVQHGYAEIRLSQESEKTFSLAGSSGGADLRSKRYNVVMIGDSSVGKTSFMKRAQSGKFSLDLPASVGLDSCEWTVVVDGKPVVLQLWDTAGQERFHSITRQIFHKSQAFLLMYDITSCQSFSAVSYWASCIQEGAAENVTTVLLGNKSDHAERRVKTQEGEILAREYNFEFMECSAATGENVIQSLETVARMLSQKVDTREEVLVLKKESQQKKSSGCC